MLMTLRSFHWRSPHRGSGLHQDDYFDRGRDAWPHWFGLGWVGGPCRIDNGVYLFLHGRWIGKAFGKDGIDGDPTVGHVVGCTFCAIRAGRVLAFLPANGGGEDRGLGKTVYYGIILAALRWRAFHTSGPDGKTLRQFGLWALIFGGIVMAYGIWEDISRNSAGSFARVNERGNVVLENNVTVISTQRSSSMAHQLTHWWTQVPH